MGESPSSGGRGKQSPTPTVTYDPHESLMNLDFYLLAIEHSIRREDWLQAERHADILERYASA